MGCVPPLLVSLFVVPEAHDLLGVMAHEQITYYLGVAAGIVKHRSAVGRLLIGLLQQIFRTPAEAERRSYLSAGI